MSAARQVVVVGAGVMGSWTARCLRALGLEVTLLDAYGAGNALSSSGDESRVTRSAHGHDSFYPARPGCRAADGQRPAASSSSTAANAG